jgi:hypothetical protein
MIQPQLLKMLTTLRPHCGASAIGWRVSAACHRTRVEVSTCIHLPPPKPPHALPMKCNPHCAGALQSTAPLPQLNSPLPFFKSQGLKNPNSLPRSTQLLPQLRGHRATPSTCASETEDVRVPGALCGKTGGVRCGTQWHFRTALHLYGSCHTCKPCARPRTHVEAVTVESTYQLCAQNHMHTSHRCCNFQVKKTPT